jgi:DNA-binding transcriptional ArsR family regulator
MKSQQRYEARARIAKALAHPSRLMMLYLLGEATQARIGIITQQMQLLARAEAGLLHI